MVYHVLNRGNGRMEIFRKPGDYQAFVELMIDAKERAQIQIFGFCLMPNHWHLVVRPARPGPVRLFVLADQHACEAVPRPLPPHQRPPVPGTLQELRR